MAQLHQKTTKTNRCITKEKNMKNVITYKINNDITLTKNEIAYYILFMAKNREVDKYLKLWKK